MELKESIELIETVIFYIVNLSKECATEILIEKNWRLVSYAVFNSTLIFFSCLNSLLQLEIT